VLVRVADSQLDLHHARTGGAQDLAQLGLRPDGAEHPRARPDHRHGLVPQRARRLRARRPVDGVLQHARDRRVVFRCREQHEVGVGDRAAKPLDRRRALRAVVVLVIRWDRLEAVEDLELAAVLLDNLAGRAQQPGVVGVAAQASTDAEDLH
jgi:hypothetical protein